MNRIITCICISLLTFVGTYQSSYGAESLEQLPKDTALQENLWVKI